MASPVASPVNPLMAAICFGETALVLALGLTIFIAYRASATAQRAATLAPGVRCCRA